MESNPIEHVVSKTSFIPVLGAFSGWLMDGYVSIGYLLVATTLSTQFFPKSYGGLALVAIFLGLPFGAVARIVGSITLGNFLGDRYGRRTMLVYSIIGFSIFSFAIAFLPVYSQVGYVAPVLLFILLFMVGIFAGAEYAGGAALSMENVPQKSRLFVGSFVQSGYGVGFFLISLVIYLIEGPLRISSDLSWRYMYLTTIIPALAALVIRLFTNETEVFKNMQKEGKLEKVPLFGIIRQLREYFATLLILSGLLFINIITFSFFPTLLIMFDRLTYPTMGRNALIATMGIQNAYINLVSLAGVWIGGFAGYYLFRRKLSLSVFTILFFIAFIPAYYLTPVSIQMTVVAFSIIAFFEAAIFSSIPAFLTETFNKAHRTTAVGTVYNFASLPASFALTLIAYLWHVWNNSASITFLLELWVFFVLIGIAVMAIGIFLSKETVNSGVDSITT